MSDDELIIWLRDYFIKKNAPAWLINRLDEIEINLITENMLADAYDESFKDGEEYTKYTISVGEDN